MSAQATSGARRALRVLALSDEVDARLYTPRIRERFGGVDLLLSCGDLPASYLDFVASMLNAPLYGVHGNHDTQLERAGGQAAAQDTGMEELHGRVAHVAGLVLGGFDGSIRYNRDDAYQFTEAEMRLAVARMLPSLLRSRLRTGRFLDVLVTHSPPRHVNDQEDRPHRGFEVFRWFLRTFRPRYHLHGHIHLYGTGSGYRVPTRTRYFQTEVLNVFPYRELRIDLPG